MRHASIAPGSVLAVALLAACAELPTVEMLDYESCIQLNAEPIPPAGDDDPHDGWKDVYACRVTLDDLVDGDGTLLTPPWPDGSLVIKTSCFTGPCDEDGAYPWLLATAEKQDGAWTWKEYTRNFPDDKLALIGAPESLCIDCHAKYENQDWIVTLYEAE